MWTWNKGLRWVTLLLGNRGQERPPKYEVIYHQWKYLENILEIFRMETCKTICTPSQVEVCFYIDMSPQSEQEEEKTSRVIYFNMAGRPMYEMVCTIPNITHVVCVGNRYMTSLVSDH